MKRSIKKFILFSHAGNIKLGDSLVTKRVITANMYLKQANKYNNAARLRYEQVLWHVLVMCNLAA